MAPYFGAAIHKGAEVMYRGGGQKEVMEAFAEEYSEYWRENIDSERSIENGYVVLQNFMRRFPPKEDYLKTIEVGGKLGVEQGFSVMLSEEVVFSGRIDRLALWEEELVIEDWKTSRYVGSGYIVLKPNDQFTGYAFGASDILGKAVKTIFITQIGTYVKKQRKEGGKVIRLTEDDERVDLVRVTTTRTEEDYEDWKERLLRTANKIAFAEKGDYWPMQPHSCPSFQGCEYLPLCSAQSNARESIADTFFKKDEWKAYQSIE
jgi:ATP-dependent exoDNAse (exonuclease V) beta subunit